MPTKINGRLQIQTNSIVRSLLNTAVSGLALILKVIPGNNITISSTGADAGTGDVTITATNYSTRRTVADQNATISGVAPIDQFLAFTSLTAPRIVALPAAALYPPGSFLYVKDESGNCSTTNTITINRVGADLINNQTSVVINSAYGGVILTSNGSNAWTYLATSSPSLLPSFTTGQIVGLSGYGDGF